jgi:hypothetical protein
MVRTWRKQGLLLSAPLGQEWSVTHAALPTVGAPRDRGGDVVDLYVSTRDRQGRSWIARALLDVCGERPEIAALDPEPVLAPGQLGAFDDAGVTPSCVVRHGDDTLLYYTGWARGVSVPFYLGIGLAVSRDGGPFERVSRAPILGRTLNDPFMTASPYVLREPEGWRMWYVSCARWVRIGDGVRHYYHLRHGMSEDGVSWETDGRACLDFADEQEYAFSRPSVVRGHDGYEMWFSVRGDAYRLGYARSANGLAWRRRDGAAGVLASAEGWDAEMVAYPHVFEHRGRRLMLYNGNGYGATGVGSAVSA